LAAILGVFKRSGLKKANKKFNAVKKLSAKTAMRMMKAHGSVVFEVSGNYRVLNLPSSVS
jgi:hypothetical protein